MSKDRPTTQEHLIDHLLRIIQGVSKTGPDENGIVEWGFGFGEDALTTYQPSSPEDQKEWNEQGREWKKDAQLELKGLLLAIEAGDHMGIPKRLAKLRRKRAFNSIPLDEVVAVGEAWAKLETSETKKAAYEIAYAYEALNKLKDMVDRGQNAVQKRHLLLKVPRWVDRYMSEAASCFRYGFDLACISLCRAALEESLKDRLKEEFGPQAITEWNKDQKKWDDVDLCKLINRASKYKILKFPEESHNIRSAGNKCVHGELQEEQVRPTALEVLFLCRLITQDVYSGN
jgi:hypothetical protein